MKNGIIILGAILALSLVGCGENEASTEPAPKDAKVAKVAKKAKGFVGAKLAPPPADMSFHAGWAMMVERPEYMTEPCNQRMNPSKVAEECIGQLEVIGSKSTFEPRECRKGDERSHKFDRLVVPVSCDGRVSTPALRRTP